MSSSSEEHGVVSDWQQMPSKTGTNAIRRWQSDHPFFRSACFTLGKKTHSFNPKAVDELAISDGDFLMLLRRGNSLAFVPCGSQKIDGAFGLHQTNRKWKSVRFYSKELADQFPTCWHCSFKLRKVLNLAPGAPVAWVAEMDPDIAVMKRRIRKKS